MTVTYKIPTGVQYIDPDAVLTDEQFDVAVEALIDAAQAYADQEFGADAVRVIGVAEHISAGNQNIADDADEERILSMMDSWVENNWLDVVAGTLKK